MCIYMSMPIGEQHWTCTCYSSMQGLSHAIITRALAPSGVRSTRMPSAEMSLGLHIQELLEAASGNVRACTIIVRSLATVCFCSARDHAAPLLQIPLRQNVDLSRIFSARQPRMLADAVYGPQQGGCLLPCIRQCRLPSPHTSVVSTCVLRAGHLAGQPSSQILADHLQACIAAEADLVRMPLRTRCCCRVGAFHSLTSRLPGEGPVAGRLPGAPALVRRPQLLSSQLTAGKTCR